MTILIGNDPLLAFALPDWNNPLDIFCAFLAFLALIAITWSAWVSTVKAIKKRSTFMNMIAVYSIFVCAAQYSNVIGVYLSQNYLSNAIRGILSAFSGYLFILTQTQTLRLVIISEPKARKYIWIWSVVHTLIHFGFGWPNYVLTLAVLAGAPSSVIASMSLVSSMYLGWTAWLYIYDFFNSLWVTYKIYAIGLSIQSLQKGKNTDGTDGQSSISKSAQDSQTSERSTATKNQQAKQQAYSVNPKTDLLGYVVTKLFPNGSTSLVQVEFRKAVIMFMFVFCMDIISVSLNIYTSTLKSIPGPNIRHLSSSAMFINSSVYTLHCVGANIFYGCLTKIFNARNSNSKSNKPSNA